MSRSLISSIEPLESRIAPAAVAVLNPLVAMAAGMSENGGPSALSTVQSAEQARADFFRHFGGAVVPAEAAE